jgi:glycosyltransferase involved in cell wall biosynthesis
MFTNFSLIISIYKNIKFYEIKRTFDSLDKQQIKPKQIIVVFDGFYPEYLKLYVINFFNYYVGKDNLIVIKNPSNKGISFSYNAAIKKSKYDLIAIQDSDDESAPSRFKLQLEYFKNKKNLSVLGGSVLENYYKKKVVKKMPLTYNSIKNYIFFKNPINHPTVMFRKNDLLSSSMYSECKRMEDYYLWINLISRGLYIENMPNILVKSYIDTNFMKRRSSATVLKSEIMIQLLLLKKFRQYIFLSFFIVPLKIFYHLMPLNIKLRLRLFVNSIFSF